MTGRTLKISKGGGGTTKKDQKLKEGCKLEFFLPYMLTSSSSYNTFKYTLYTGERNVRVNKSYDSRKI